MKTSSHLVLKTILLVFMFVALSCQKHESRMSVAEMAVPPRISYASLSVADEKEQQAIDTDRKLIRTGYLELEMKDAVKSKVEIEKIFREFHAYVSSESQDNLPQRLQYVQVVRIPAGKFDLLLQKLEALSVKVESKNIQTTDVTEEFIDKEARIKTRKELENRYREILKQAKTVPDILSIESQLNDVRSDIESMEGRMNYLRNQVAFSTLNLTYYQPIGTDFGFGSKTAASFGNGWRSFLDFLIGLLNVWPFILITVTLIYVVFRKVRMSKILKADALNQEQ
jgi:hypothetical protein